MNMASASSIIEDIDDKFCQCCLCFEQYKDPRQLPCLHRFCTDCLQKLIKQKQGDARCPLCQEPVDIPDNGAEGFKKDFYMNEIIEYVQIKKSLKDNKSITCGDCSKAVNATAYCFKCCEFLCGDCHEYHLTKKSLKDHRSHLLTLRDVESKNITLERLSSLKEAPRCESHPEDLSRLCCITCSNKPICVACTYGDHENHKIKDVNTFAKQEKERLQQKVDLLSALSNEVSQTLEKAKSNEKDIRVNADQHSRDLKSKHQTKMSECEAKMDFTRATREMEEKRIRSEEMEYCSAKDKEMEDKIKLIRIEYEKMKETKREDSQQKLKTSAEKYDSEEHQIKSEMDTLKEKFRTTLKLIEKEDAQRMNKNAEIKQQLEHTVERYENIVATCTNIFISKNSWTVVQNIDSICRATEPLLQEMKREFPKLREIPQFSDEAMGVRGPKNVRLSQQPERVVDIEGFSSKGWYLNGITCTRNGDIVTSGGAFSKQSFIEIITMKGNSVKQQLIAPNGNTLEVPVCYCAPIQEFKVATASELDEIGLLDIRDQSYYKKNLRDLIHLWPSNRRVRCITTDEVNNNVIVGCYDMKDVYVLDDQLNHQTTITLPETTGWPCDITVSDGQLLVCDGERARAVNMKGELLYDFTKPGIKGCDKPLSVCSNGNGFIYILWVEVGWVSSDQNCVVAQYNHDGRHLLFTTSLYTDARCITIAATDQTEKLLVATYRSGKLHVFGLEDSNE